MKKTIFLKANVRLENMHVEIPAKEAIEKIMDMLGHGEIYGEKPYISNGAIYVHEDCTGRGEHYRARLVTRDKSKVEELKALLLIKDRIEAMDRTEKFSVKESVKDYNYGKLGKNKEELEDDWELEP